MTLRPVSLEVLLFSIGDCVLEARDEFKSMYDVELPHWSRKLEYALAQLEQSNATASREDMEAEADLADAALRAAE